MALVLWCPQCQLPLTVAEAADGHCALCGNVLPLDRQTPVDENGPPRVVEVPPSLLARWQLWAGLGLVFVFLLVAGFVAVNWPDRPGAHNQVRHEKTHTPAEVIGPPIEVVVDAQEFVGPPDDLKPALVVAKTPEFVGPPDDLKPPVVAAKRNVAANETLLNDPNGEYVVPALVNGKTLKLTGQIRRLRLSGLIAGRAVLDASQLEAQEIIVEQAILNDATVKLNAPRGSVECRGQIAGRVNLSINAPGGAVTFKANSAPILNESKLTITAGRLDLQERLQGWNTRVEATLTAGGHLHFKEIGAGCKLTYQKAAPKDPDVQISGGDVLSQGELRPAAGAKQTDPVGPPEALRPLRKALKTRVIGTETFLDDTDGEYIIESPVNGQTLKLTGRVRRLKIGELNSRVTLDASQLEAKEIIVVGGICNGSTARLNAPNGSVEFHGPVSRAKVYVAAPNGTVCFKANAPITNEAKVYLTASNIEFADLIQGWNTLVETTLTPGGHLEFKELTTGCKLHYKKAQANDPDLEIVPGTVRDQAELK